MAGASIPFHMRSSYIIHNVFAAYSKPHLLIGSFSLYQFQDKAVYLLLIPCEVVKKLTPACLHHFNRR